MHSNTITLTNKMLGWGCRSRIRVLESVKSHFKSGTERENKGNMSAKMVSMTIFQNKIYILF